MLGNLYKSASYGYSKLCLLLQAYIYILGTHNSMSLKNNLLKTKILTKCYAI